MIKRSNFSMTAGLCMIITVLFATQFAGIAQGQPYGQQAAYTGLGTGGYPGSVGGLTIQGMEGLQGFYPGENRLSLAIHPVGQQG